MNEPAFPPEPDAPESPRSNEPRQPFDLSRQGRARGRGCLRAFLLIALALILLAAGAAGYIWRRMDQAAIRQPDRTDQLVRVSVPRGSSVEDIADILIKHELLPDRRVFYWHAWRTGKGRSMQAGDYYLRANMSVDELIEALQYGRFESKVTFPEGFTTARIAERLAEAELIGAPEDVLALRDDPELLEMAGWPGPPLEGCLFPDTYFMEIGATPRQLVERMISMYLRRAEEACAETDQPLEEPLNRYELTTLASMIQREARSLGEMPIIASVYYNRLRLGMPLQCDATVHYAMNNWSRTLTHADYEIDHPYNTYKSRGLPPGPICNPGIEAMRAAARPADTEYLYYVANAALDGHVFTTSLREHNAAIRQSRRERSQRRAINPAPSPSPTPTPDVEVLTRPPLKRLPGGD